MSSMSSRIVYLRIKNIMSSMSSHGPYILSKTDDSSFQDQILANILQETDLVNSGK